MDRLIAETEIEQEKEVAISENLSKSDEKTPDNAEKLEKVEEKEEIIVKSQPPVNSYLNSFENKTIADIKREEEEKKLAEFEKEKEELIAAQYVEADKKVEEVKEEPKEEKVVSSEPSQNIIEKPNYDLLEEPKKIFRLKTSSKSRQSKSKKTVGLALACVLGAVAIVCVTNTIIIDQFQSSFIQIDETYKLKLADYLKNINNLDNAKNGMEMFETYPDETKPAGDLGQKSNWFDRICNFIARLFGG